MDIDGQGGGKGQNERSEPSQPPAPLEKRYDAIPVVFRKTVLPPRIQA